MKSAGHLVSSATKLTTCMQHSKYYFKCRLSGFVIHSNRNTTSVIFNGNGIVLFNCYFDILTITGKCLIHGIIHNLINQMMKSSCGCTSDVHTRSLSYRFKSLQNLDLIRSIFLIVLQFFTHEFPPHPMDEHLN